MRARSHTSAKRRMPRLPPSMPSSCVSPISQILRASWRSGIASRLMFRSEEHTSELQSLMRISYAVFCLKKKIQQKKSTQIIHSILENHRCDDQHYKYTQNYTNMNN